MTSLLVRPAAPADAEQIGMVHNNAWREAYRGLLPVAAMGGADAVARARQWRTNIASGARDVFVAVSDGHVVGFCSVAPSRDVGAGADCGEVTALYVDPSAWRRGYGRGLVRAAWQHALVRRWRELTLWVLRSNQVACSFYSSLGFRPDGAEKVEGDPPLLEVRYRSVVDAG